MPTECHVTPCRYLMLPLLMLILHYADYAPLYLMLADIYLFSSDAASSFSAAIAASLELSAIFFFAEFTMMP